MSGRTRARLEGAEQTLLLTLGMRARDARSAQPVLGDEWAPRIVERIDHPWWLLSPLLAGNQPLIVGRAKSIDEAVAEQIARRPDLLVVHLACGLDSRALRVERPATVRWIDVDRPRVIELRRRLYGDAIDAIETLAASAEEPAWWRELPADRPALVVAEGLLMYLSPAEVAAVSANVFTLREPALIADSISGAVRDATRLLPPAIAHGARFRSSTADADRALAALPAELERRSSVVVGESAGGTLGVMLAGLRAVPPIRDSFVLSRWSSAAVAETGAA